MIYLTICIIFADDPNHVINIAVKQSVLNAPQDEFDVLVHSQKERQNVYELERQACYRYADETEEAFIRRQYEHDLELNNFYGTDKMNRLRRDKKDAVDANLGHLLSVVLRATGCDCTHHADPKDNSVIFVFGNSKVSTQRSCHIVAHRFFVKKLHALKYHCYTMHESWTSQKDPLFGTQLKIQFFIAQAGTKFSITGYFVKVIGKYSKSRPRSTCDFAPLPMLCAPTMSRCKYRSLLGSYKRRVLMNCRLCFSFLTFKVQLYRQRSVESLKL